MHSLTNRAQAAFSYFTSVAFAVAAVIAVSVLIQPQAPKAGLQLRNVQVYDMSETFLTTSTDELHSVKGRPNYYTTKREEYAHVKFDLDADLSSLFHWNTKQIFAYVVASYPSTSPATIPPSEAVIWDAVIPAENAPFHVNTYLHPQEKATSKLKSKVKKDKKKKLAYPAGTQPGILKLPNQKPKYQISDITGLNAERENVTLTLRWNVQPWVGALLWTNHQTHGRWQGLEGGQSESFNFPPLKGSEVKKEDLKTATGAEARKGYVAAGSNEHQTKAK